MKKKTKIMDKQLFSIELKYYYEAFFSLAIMFIIGISLMSLMIFFPNIIIVLCVLFLIFVYARLLAENIKIEEMRQKDIDKK